MPSNEDPRMSESARIGFIVALLSILGLLFLMITIGPLLNESYKIDSLVVVGAVPVLLGAVLLLAGVELPDWWNRR